MEGYLYKWVNFMYGWKRRYFVLHAGVLRYCADKGSHAKGAVHLNLAQIYLHPTKPVRFKIDTGVTVLHLKGSSVEEVQLWIEALQNSKCELEEDQHTREHRSTVPDMRISQDNKTLIEKVSELSVLEAELEELIEEKRLTSDNETQALLEVARNLRQQAANLLTLFEEEDKNTAKLKVELERVSLSPSPKKQSPFAYYAENVNESQVFHDALSHASFEEILEASSDKSARKCLPVLRNPRHNTEAWKALKETSGENVDVPVSYSEPLSTLQRLTEDLAFSSLLSDAAKQTDPALRLAFVVLFVRSAYSCSPKRTMRPFTPLVGETFELERDGFKVLVEQVAKNVSVLQCTHDDFELSGTYEPQYSYHHNQLTIEPLGTWRTKLGDSTYTWTKPSSVISGFNSGDLQLSHTGKVTVADLKSLYSAHLDFGIKPGSNVVSGSVVSPTSSPVYSFVEARTYGLDVLNPRKEVAASWAPRDFPEAYQYNYFWSEFALQLNLQPELYSDLASSDSRNRPDLRALERGDLERAETEKRRLEHMNLHAQSSPRWFRLVNSEWVMGGFWEAKAAGELSRLPEIF
jgi:hypothetical protein